MSAVAYDPEVKEVEAVCAILAPLAERPDLHRRIIHRIRNGHECYKMFGAYLDAALDNDRSADEPILTADDKVRAGLLLGVLREISPNYDADRDGAKVWAWKRPVDFRQALAAARGEGVYGESKPQREARERGDLDAAIPPRTRF